MFNTRPSQVGIRELRDQLTTIMRRVKLGETIEVTHHNNPIATITPTPTNQLERLIATGVITPPSRPLQLHGQRLTVTTGISASKALEDDRNSEQEPSR